MGRPYSEDLRIRIVAAVEAGGSCSAAARQFGVSPSCAIKLLQRFRRTGSVAPAPRARNLMRWPMMKCWFASLWPRAPI